MKIIIHDLEEINFLKLDNSYLILNPKNNCKGCFNCWTKTPLKCFLNDELKYAGKTLMNSEELIIISKCINGSYSYKVKKVLERCISYVEPYFILREKEIHHKSRINNKLNIKVFFYGDISELDKKIAINLLNQNRKNFNTNKPLIYFIKDKKEIKL